MGDSRSVVGNSWQNTLMTSYALSGDWIAGQGWTTATLLTNVETVSDFGSNALVNIGSVDLLSMPSENDWKTDILAIVDTIHARNTNTTIYLAKPWRLSYDSEANTLAGWIDDVVTLRDFVFVGHNENVWLKGEDNGAAMTSDGIHYSVAGEAECASQWQAILGL